MEEAKRKYSLNILAIALLVIILPIAFLVFTKYSYQILNSPSMPSWFFGPIGLLMILAIGLIWILLIKSLFKRHIRIKIILMLLGATFLIAILFWWIVGITGIMNPW
jgi:glucan phosphoethanolaminetransferase (alkaline phosphatase superfamily)